ncbi:MAG TPA: LpqB family beta-propeller domain-containing protein, partial [Kineosporiaceae bacterium]|nr:LpqB family beta-propeller domain-containing protein [Kineosporiaceae bacterium]
MNGRGRRVAVPTLVTVVCLLLGGCVSIPGSGPVVDARRVEHGPGGVVVVLPAGPSLDATPRDLIRDFLRAAAAFTNDHEVARSFLVPEQRLSWRPDSPVVIYPNEDTLSISVTRGNLPVPEPAVAGPTPAATSTPRNIAQPTGRATAKAAAKLSAAQAAAKASAQAASSLDSAPPTVGELAKVTVKVPVQARVDSTGQYTVSPAGDVEIRHFELIGTEQGWRVASLDDGILVKRADFAGAFRDLPLYFADATDSYLVPDVRWFPISGTTATPSTLVATLLTGASAWLHPAVISGAPPGTEPTINAVKVQDGVATVDLTSSVRTADGRQRQMLHAQLDRTLTTLSQLGILVNSVVITVEQQRFELQPAPVQSAAPRADSESGAQLRPSPPVDPRPVVIDARGAVARLIGSTSVPVAGLAALALPGAVAPAVDAGGQNYAVLVAGRTKLLHAVPSGVAVPLIRGRDLVAPSFDPFGWVWSGQAVSGGVLYAARPLAAPAVVKAPWLIGARILSLRMSREGARAVLVLDRPGTGPEVYVCG